MSAPASPDGLSGLAGQVDVTTVRSLLLQRGPRLFDDPANQDLLVQFLLGVAAEVEQITGDVPPDSPYRNLALWAVALGTAANIEDALFPESDLGDGGRAARLQARYLGVRKQLAQAVSSTGGSGGSAGPQGNGFTPPSPWPDPAGPDPAWSNPAWSDRTGWRLLSW